MKLDMDYHVSLVKMFYNIPLSEIKAFVESEATIDEYITQQISNLDDDDFTVAYMAFSMRICVYGMRVGKTERTRGIIFVQFNELADKLERFFGTSVVVRPEPLGTIEGEQSLKRLKLLI